MNEPELKTCPFCGKKAVLLTVYSADGKRAYWAVKCESCKVQTHYEDTKLKAAENWNKRAC